MKIKEPAYYNKFPQVDYKEMIYNAVKAYEENNFKPIHFNDNFINMIYENTNILRCTGKKS